MNEEYRKELSAFVDGELDDDQARFLLRRICHDDELRDAWNRWWTVKAAMRHECTPLPTQDLCTRISSAVADIKPDAAQLPPARQPRRLGWAALSAAAAVFAAVLVVVVSGPLGDEPASVTDEADTFVADTEMRPATTTAATEPAPRAALQRAALRQEVLLEYDDPRLQSYLLRHREASLANGKQSLMPHLHLVANVSTASAEAP